MICYRIPFPEWSNITNCLPVSGLISIQVLQRNLCCFFISEKKEIQRYITNRKLLVFLFFLIWDCRQNYNAKLGYICNTESPKTWLGKRGVSKKNYWDFVIFATEYIFWLLGINEYWIIKENVGNEYWFWSSYRQGPVFR